jgi:hypothetical protein
MIFPFFGDYTSYIIGLVKGKIYRKAPYLMGKSMVSCKFSLKPIQSLSPFILP